jgi:hypothetical protein
LASLKVTGLDSAGMHKPHMKKAAQKAAER